MINLTQILNSADRDGAIADILMAKGIIGLHDPLDWNLAMKMRG
jgi:hypothetical protein